MPASRKPGFKMQKKQMEAVNLMFEGKSIPEIAEAIFDIRGPDGLTDKKKKKSAERQIHYWAERPEFVDAYRKLQQSQMMPRYSKAMMVFDKQLDDANPWVAQGAAREILNRCGPAIMGESESEVVVRIENAPALGTPDELEPAETEDEE